MIPFNNNNFLAVDDKHIQNNNIGIAASAFCCTVRPGSLANDLRSDKAIFPWGIPNFQSVMF